MVVKSPLRTSVIILIIIVPLIITFNIMELKHESEEKTRLQMISDVESITLEYFKWISVEMERLKITRNLVSNLTLSELTYSSTKNKYFKMINGDGKEVPIYVGLADGKMISGDSWEATEGYDPRNRVWYTDAVMKNEIVVSEVYKDHLTEELMVTISSPLYLDIGFAGVIGLDIELVGFNEHLNSLELEQGEYAYLIDSNDMVLAHTKHPEYVGRNLESIELDVDLKSILEDVSLRAELQTYEYGGEEIVAIFRELPEMNLKLAVASRLEDVNISQNKVSRNVVFFNILFLSVIVWIIYLLLTYEIKLRWANLQLVEKSETDALTQIKNRGKFAEVMDTYWKQAEGNGDLVGLLLFDVDYFKKYNDCYGHIQGDKALIEICKIVNEVIKAEDVFARFGGEEFVVVRYGGSLEEVRELGNRIVSAIYEAAWTHESSDIGRLSVSVGTNSLIPNSDFSIDRFIYQADIALYEAKNSGKNCVK